MILSSSFIVPSPSCAILILPSILLHKATLGISLTVSLLVVE